MLCNMFLYVVQHVFWISANCTIYIFPGILHFLQIAAEDIFALFANSLRSVFAHFADSCRRIH